MATRLGEDLLRIEDELFLQAILNDPENDIARGVFADFLERQGDRRGELLRIVDLLRRQKLPRRSKLETRLRALLYREHLQPVAPCIVNSIGMPLVLIPPGRFRMGSPQSEIGRNNDEQRTEAELTRSFLLGKYLVTQGEYQKLMGVNPSGFAPSRGQPAGHSPSEAQRLPVESVSWYEATQFCAALSQLPAERNAGREYRLPTEAQWEYACRAGTTTPFCFGRSLHSNQANFNGTYSYKLVRRGRALQRPGRVGLYAPNGFGLYDMHGTLWEWCQDAYCKELPGGRDPLVEAPDADRVNRGGSWFNIGSCCRSACRDHDPPSCRDDSLGFRVAAICRRPIRLPPLAPSLQLSAS